MKKLFNSKRILAVALAVATLITSIQFPISAKAETEEVNLALNKTVYCSSEEGLSPTSGKNNVAESAVDGKNSTGWVAQTKDQNNNWDAKYPEWLCVDLGDVYDITKIDLNLESKNGARIYDYKIYASNNVAPVEGVATLPTGYEVIVDKTGNTESGVQSTVTFTNQMARYVLVEILSCNQYDSNKWQAATIFELAVYGNVETEEDDDNIVIDIPVQTASGRDESYAVELDGEWAFGGKLLSATDALKADYSDWEKITIPHTWNAADGEDGGGNYERTAYWYHKEFTLDDNYENKRVYIEFLGSNTKTDVYVNGTKVGDTHKGGYTTFRYDITDAVKIGDNKIDVMVDNRYDATIAPISGDFNMYGGIYRRVYLVAVDDVHVDLENNGSSGLFLTTGNMRSKEKPSDLGKFNIKADIVNVSNVAKTVSVVATVTGDNAPAPITQEITIPANGKVTFSKDVKVENPTLWEGIRYEKGKDNSNAGYQYTVTLEIKEGSTIVDKVEDKLGFRYFWIDVTDNGESGDGFFLNGKKFPLRGVNRHSYIAEFGSAMTEEMHAADMNIMLDLGVNTIRLCHYPQTDYFYDLCDANGIVVWTEIPIVNEVRASEEFEKITKNQLTELIYQQYNRPSVVFWGLENEIGNGQSLTSGTGNADLKKAKELLFELDSLAKELDTTGRYTTQAVNRDYAMNQNDPDSVNKNFENNTGWKSDTVAWNIYPGWYPDANFYGSFEDVMVRKGALDSRSMGISEYGWGANVNQHEAYPELGKNNLTSGGVWHPEEYQNIMNEEALDYINAHDELWGTYYWVMFDFAVDARNEGGQAALNDKGLVTADREIKKDSFYLYKANWNKADSFTYITSRRWTERDTATTYIKVYSNCEEVELFINGESLGKMEAAGNGVFLMKDVLLPVGEVNVKTVGTIAGENEKYEDSCVWSRSISTKAEVESDEFAVDTKSLTVVINKEVTLKQFKEMVSGVNAATYKVYEGAMEVIDDDAKILPGMTLVVVAEDGITTSTYTVMSGNLCVGKPVISTSNELGNIPENAVDANSSTKWVAVDGTYPQSITVDLEDIYCFGDLTLNWDTKGGNRYYKYYVEVSEDGTNFTEVLDKRDNTVMGIITDSMKLAKGRYIRITATGCNVGGWATLWEIGVDGFKIDSDEYDIDDKNELIILEDIPQTGLAEGAFTDNINVTGNCKYVVNLSSGWIHDGNTVDIVDSTGKIIATYTICTEATKDKYIVENENNEGIENGGTDTKPKDEGAGGTIGDDSDEDNQTGVNQMTPNTGDMADMVRVFIIMIACVALVLYNRRKVLN